MSADHEDLNPDSAALSAGYDPASAWNAIKPPLVTSASFVFSTAEEGARYFAQQKSNATSEGFIYTRLGHPNAAILEERLKRWDKAEACAAFESGMGAIATTLLALLKPGDALAYSQPLYGGTEHFFRTVLQPMDIRCVGFDARLGQDELLIWADAQRVSFKMIYVETPANPTNELCDLRLCRALANAQSQPALVLTDNTYAGPIWQHPLEHGADLVLYSATKYLGGHSDLVAGAVCGSKALIEPIRKLRSTIGTTIGPHTAWMLTRSLETLRLRMERQAENARIIAHFLSTHPKVARVIHPSLWAAENEPLRTTIMQRQMEGSWAMVSFELKGGREEAFQFLNALRLIRLSVSLGSTESMASHPATMSHHGVSPDDKARFGISESLIRLSAGIEQQDDLLADLSRALDVC